MQMGALRFSQPLRRRNSAITASIELPATASLYLAQLENDPHVAGETLASRFNIEAEIRQIGLA